MKKLLAEHRIAFLLLTILLLVQSFSADLNNPYRKPISGDAQAYYAYLPAIFIYQDLDYQFVPEMQQKYYVAASSKSFLKDVNGEKVNKTFPGVSLLYLPFFAAAHAISLVFGLPADGYAYTYQLLYLIGFWFYFLAGLIFFRKVLLELNFTPRIVDASLIAITLGTNIFFYTVYDQSVTHIYSFFLVNWSLFLLLRLKKEFKLRPLALLISILALIGITRPTNILVIGVLLFFVNDFAFYKALFVQVFRIKNIFKIIFPSLLILSIPFILWKLQTGNWIVYSYGEEGFDFTKPEIMNFLFSYTKGWFIYTPIMLLILIFGFIILFKQNRKQVLIGLAFFGIAIYIFSSWWCWYYGAGMSQRVMIDFYILPGFLLAVILQKMSSKKVITVSLISIFVCFNIAQAYQISKGILPFGSPTKAQYWDNFLAFKKRAQVYPQEHWASVSKNKISLNPADSMVLKGNTIELENNWCLQTTETDEYSAVVRIPEQHYKKGNKLILTFEARAKSDVEKTRLVIHFNNFEDQVFFLKDYISEGWQTMQYLIEINTTCSSSVELYLWNAGSKERVDLKNLSWELYYSEEYF
ncbi:MAG: hypothetical protein IPO32_00595 [Crocinitomicaceae bacterium]|nr:hypothetical protein [Crocinitomicaceae bacterium]